MGAACCVAAQDITLPIRTGSETVHRNVVYSPSWSFRWENRGRVAGEIESSSYHPSQGSRRNASQEIKSITGSERANTSDAGSLLANFGTPTSQKSPIHEGKCANIMNTPSDMSVASTYSPEVKNFRDSSEITEALIPNISFSVPSFSPPTKNLLHSQTHSLPPASTPSRRARRSPGHQLFRQVSDSRILGLKSPSNFSISEGRPSFVLSTCSNDLKTGSNGGSSDGWSMRTFSELVASSRRERWSFDSEQHMGSEFGKISGSSSRFSYSPSPSIDMRTCGACSKLLTERSSWSSNEISVAAVLICGHVYHADCLETMTAEAARYDPTCPVCTLGQNKGSKMSKKALKIEAELKARNSKISRNRVVDSYLDDDEDDFVVLDRRKSIVPKMEPSSSSRTPKPFLRRHFSLRSKWSSKSLLENDSARRKGFWSRYRKD